MAQVIPDRHNNRMFCQTFHQRFITHGLHSSRILKEPLENSVIWLQYLNGHLQGDAGGYTPCFRRRKCGCMDWNMPQQNHTGQDNTVMPEIPALTQLTTSLNKIEQTVQNQGTLIQSLLVRESNIISQPAVVSDIDNGVHHDTGSFHTTKHLVAVLESPKIFDTLSVAICWILQNNYGLWHVLYLLDDFLLINNPYVDATRNMNTMLYVFNSLKIPLSAHKTVGPSTSLEYLGIILDSMHMIAKLPDEKLVRIKDILYSYLNRRSCTKREILSLVGHLNHACKVIIPERSFVSYLLTLAHSVYHHVTITKGCRDDMAMWFKFLSQWNGISFFISHNVINASDFHLFTDASSTILIGYGGYFRKRWFQGIWPDDFIRPNEESFSMAYLELYPIVISAILWGHVWSTKRILFHCDNMSSVYIINKGRSKCNVIMNLVRRLTWCAAKFNFVVHAAHVPGKENNIADALSRYQMKRFRQLAPDASPNQCTCPPHSEILWS
ncbi:unnamed protein product [Mytilus edulis]|uniref:RNase H type-1 domain-containing protein n=2 Tax=Mytilus edulis TaxID=6550 RepID=A0A8S3QMS6_MYTED|nr:unnamed protein product [Mytilus edulis]